MVAVGGEAGVSFLAKEWDWPWDRSRAVWEQSGIDAQNPDRRDAPCQTHSSPATHHSAYKDTAPTVVSVLTALVRAPAAQSVKDTRHTGLNVEIQEHLSVSVSTHQLHLRLTQTIHNKCEVSRSTTDTRISRTYNGPLSWKR